MRTKRPTATKKPAQRAARPAASTPATVAPAAPVPVRAFEPVARHVSEPVSASWIAGMDRMSLAIAAAAILGAGMLVIAYRPVPRVEAAITKTEIAEPTATPAVVTAADVRAAAPAVPAMEGPDASAAGAQWPAPTTITGCLQRDADDFRLTDTSGVGAPTGRSWKSGFLKKSGTSITVVDTARHARLQDHVGQRVSVSGTIVNRQMHIDSMRAIAKSCSEKMKI